MNTVENLRLWLRSCPAISNTNRFGVDFMGQDPGEYAIYSSPSQIRYKTDVLGNTYLDSVQELNYTFISLCYFSMDILQSLDNLGFFQEIISWLFQKNRMKDFPEITEGLVLSIMPTLTPYVFDANSESGRYQIQLKIKYRPTSQ